MARNLEVVCDNDRAFAFVNSLLGINHVQGMTGICLLRDGVVIAATVYHDWNGSNIFMHIAAVPGGRWLTRDFLYWGLHYPFEQLGANRITVWINADNAVSIKFVEHLGFKLDATLKGAGPNNTDALLYVMFRQDCKYV